jgi:putative ABC transport system permease protein
MGIPHRAGRDFGASDTADSPLVAIVSESLVRRQLPGEDPIGKRLHVSIARAGGIEVEIVGVVGDVRYSALDVDTPAAVYLPHPQWPLSLITFVVRTGLDPESLVPGVAAAVRGLDPELPLADVKTMEEVVDATLARPRTVTALLAAFALIALVLAGVGVYGMMAYSVSQRTQEIGVRMALGATMGSVLRLVIGQALRLVALGVVLGLAAAALLTRLLEGLLFDTAPLDPLTFAVTALVLTLVAAAASYVPARRGARLAPTEALRTE